MSGKTVIEIYTDGSATSENLPGGWAYRVVANDSKVLSEKNGHMERASNNDAELEAALQGLSFIKSIYDKSGRDPLSDEIYLVSDSQLVLGWAAGKYKVKQERKSEKVRQLNHIMNLLGVRTKWVRGHSGNQHNERCDKLAKKARQGILEFEPMGMRKETAIGSKKKGTLAVRFKDKKFVVDLEAMVVEEYDRSTHGYREIYLQVISDEKS